MQICRIQRFVLAASSCFLLLFCFLGGRVASAATVASPPPPSANKQGTPFGRPSLVDATMSKREKDDSAVLSELKETIRKQKAELEELRKRLKVSSSPKNGAVGHGGGAHGGGGHAETDFGLYLEQPFYKVASKRVGWLSLFLGSLSLTALIMHGFDETLEKQLELAYFVPLLAGHGGNTGGQTVGTVLSAISSGAVHLPDARRIIPKEALSGLMVGILLGSVVAPLAHFVMGISSHVSTVLFCTLPLVSTIAATLGSTIPFACLALGLDPSVIAAPAMTSFVDVSGLMTYFLVAHEVFGLFGLEL